MPFPVEEFGRLLFVAGGARRFPANGRLRLRSSFVFCNADSLHLIDHGVSTDPIFRPQHQPTAAGSTSFNALSKSKPLEPTGGFGFPIYYTMERYLNRDTGRRGLFAMGK